MKMMSLKYKRVIFVMLHCSKKYNYCGVTATTAR